MIEFLELGEVKNGLLVLHDKNREYKRIRYTAPQRDFLARHGYRVVNSSCISGVQENEDNLLIRFHNGSVYRYTNAGDKYDKILASDSKGRYFNRHIKGKYRFSKLSKLPMPKNISSDELERLESLTDNELFTQIETQGFKDLVRNLTNPRIKTSFVVDNRGNELLRILIGTTAMYLTLSSLLKNGEKETLLRGLGTT